LLILKDLRISNKPITEVPSSEENLKLENRYSDSYFFNNLRDIDKSKYEYNMENSYGNFKRNYD
jgi:hypothetical protein